MRSEWALLVYYMRSPTKKVIESSSDWAPLVINDSRIFFDLNEEQKEAPDDNLAPPSEEPVLCMCRRSRRRRCCDGWTARVFIALVNEPERVRERAG